MNEIPQPARDALAAVLEAIDIPNAATMGDDERRTAILVERASHAAIMLRRILEDPEAQGDIAWSVGYLRDRLAGHPATGYKTWAEGVAEREAAQAREIGGGLDSESWTCTGCGGQMIGRRPATDLCRDCAPGGQR
jgi:hypothetical protein